MYAGLDLGSKRTRVHLRDAQGQAIDSGWVHERGELKKRLGRWGPEISVAMEATTGAFYVHDELVGWVQEGKVAHPRDLRAIAHARIKNDRWDAEKRSELNRGNLIPTVWVPSAKSRDERELILEHARTRRSVRAEKGKIHALLRRWGRGGGVAKPFTKAGLKAVMELKLPSGARYVLGAKISHLQQLRDWERKIQREIRRTIPLGDRERWLSTIPGIGEYSARWLSNVLGDVSRFPDARQVSSYTRRG